MAKFDEAAAPRPGIWDLPDWWEADDPALAALTSAGDADELCRCLLQSPWGPSSSRYAEAVDMLAGVYGSGTVPASFVAVLLCTCDRWRRVTAKLIAAIEDVGVLNDSELGDLAESLLAEKVVIDCPFGWVSPQPFEIDLSDGTMRPVPADTPARVVRRPEPPLHRWAATRALRGEPDRLDELLVTADTMEPRHRDALIHGLLDAAGVLQVVDRRRLVRRGLRCGIGRVRRAALDWLCELDGPRKARRRAASDADRRVRAWQPPAPPSEPLLPLPD